MADMSNPPELHELEELLSNLPGYDTINHNQKLHALAASVMPDSAGVWPGQPGYTTTYDVYFAALQLVGWLQGQPVVRQSSSEGSSISVDAPNWAAVTSYYRGMSKIVQATSETVLQKVTIPDSSHVVRTDMSGRGSHYGDVDTDLG